MLPEEKISNTNDTIEWLFVLLSDNAENPIRDLIQWHNVVSLNYWLTQQDDEDDDDASLIISRRTV